MYAKRLFNADSNVLLFKCDRSSMVEFLTFNQEVVGSSPADHTTIIKNSEMTIEQILATEEKPLDHFNTESIKQFKASIDPYLYFISSEMPIGTICRYVVNFYYPEKLQAVKCLKAITGQGLKECKELVDSMW